jgi:hypothetical protein
VASTGKTEVVRTLNITLIEDSTGGGLPRKFNDQSVDVSRELVTHVVSADGLASHGNHPRRLVWFGGRAEQLRGVTDVLMEDSWTAEVVIDAPLNTHNFSPADVAGGVEFWVLRRDPDEAA